MTGYEDFETRLEQALRRYGDRALVPFDADLIAERAMGAPSSRPAWRALLVPALLLALLMAATAGIITLTQPAPTPEPSPPAPEGLLGNPAGQGHATAVLGDGRVLVIHGSWTGMGQSVHSTAEIWNPASGTSTAVAGEMTTDRLQASAVTLQDGRVLVVGGFGGPYAYASSAVAAAELWDPATGRFSPTGDLTQARVNHLLSLLPDGRVLVTGGAGPEGVIAETEIYDPATGRFSATGSLLTPRAAGHSATVLGDGRVLVAGGRSTDGAALTTAETWDPRSATVQPAGDLAFARADHTATLLPDGRVLLVGGYTGTGYQTDGTGSRQNVINPDPDFVGQFVAEAEIWDSSAGFEAAGTLTTGRTGHSATALDDGRVAIIGGVTGLEQEGGIYLETLDSVEIWDAATEAFRGGQDLTEPRAEHSAIAMADGSVLILGGGSVLEELTSVVVWRDQPNSDD